MSGDATGYERASFVQPLSHDELPKDKLTMLHHAFGFSTERRDNVAYLDPAGAVHRGQPSGDHGPAHDAADPLLCIRRRRARRWQLLHAPHGAAGGRGREGAGEPNVYVFKYPTWEVVHVLRKGAEQSFSCMEFSPDGNQLATVAGNPDYIITIWDWRDERITLHTKAFGQEGPTCASRPTTQGARDERHRRTSASGRWPERSRLKLQGDIGKFGKVELSDADDFAILPDGKVLSASEAGYQPPCGRGTSPSTAWRAPGASPATPARSRT